MSGISLNVVIFLITAGPVAPSDHSKEASAPKIWSRKCQPILSDPQPPDIEDSNLDEILAAGVSYMNLQTRKANNNGSLGATFVFGNIGSGKSSVTPFMVGEMDKLNAGLTKSKSSVIYRNDNKFGSKRTTTMPMRLLPDYYLSQSVDSGLVAIWDCPGYNYSIGHKADIAQLYYLKYALQITSSANFIFTITHSNVMHASGVRGLANYATRLIKNVRKFKTSIGLIVTQVENSGARSEEGILVSIRNFLKSYIVSENNTVIDEGKIGGDVNETNQHLQRIHFIEGLLEGEDGRINNGRIHLIKLPDVCNAHSNMPWVRDTVAKLKAFQISILKLSEISPGDFGAILRMETVQEIEHVDWNRELKGIADHVSSSAQGMIRELNRTLLGSQTEIPMLEVLNRFQLAFDPYFGQHNGRSRRVSSSSAEILNPIDDDINFFVTCSNQKMKTIKFFQEVIGGKYKEENMSALLEPFELVKRGLGDITEFYNFCNKTYHTLGEYSYQSAINPTYDEIHVDNVLEFLEKASIHIPDTIRTIWKNGLEENSRKYLVDLVRKHVQGATYTREYIGRNGIDWRLTVIGRFIRLQQMVAVRYEFNKIRSRCNDSDCTNELMLIATEKFYLDDLISSNSIESYISIVAPVWEIVKRIDNDSYYHIALGGQWYRQSTTSLYGVYSNIINNLYINADGQNDEREIAGNAGSIYLVSTSSNVTVDTHACPAWGSKGLGKFPETPYSQPDAIATYNSEFIRTSLFDCFSSQSVGFFQRLASYSEGMSNKYTPISLITELESIEQEYYTKLNNIHNCPATMKRKLTSYYERTLKLIKEMLPRASTMDYTALKWIGSLIIGRQISSRNLGQTLNVFNTALYMEAVEEDLKELEILEHKDAINNETAKYKSALDGKVTETEKGINTTIKPAIESADKMIKGMNGKLLKTMEAFLNASKDAQKEAERKKQEFKDALPWKHLFSALNFVATACSFLGPVGSVVSGGIMVATSIGAQFVDKKPLDLGPLVKFTAQLPDDSDKYYKLKIENLTDSSSTDKEDVKKLKEKQKKSATALKAISFGTAAVDAGLTLIQEIQSNDAKLDELDQAVKDAEAQVNNIQNLKDNFENNLSPQLDAMSDSVVAETSKLNGTSHSGLTVKKFQMKETLKNMDSMMKDLTGWISDAQERMKDDGGTVLGEEKIYEKFVSNIQRLERAIDALFEMYGHIEMYQERKDLAQFISNVNSPTPKELNGIGDTKLRDALTRVSASIKINLAHEKYKKAEHAFKQWVFPFANHYLTGKSDNVFMQSKSFTEVVSFCRQQITSFKLNVKEANSETLTEDQFLHEADFSSDLESTEPFYVWTNDKWQDAIGRLFQGEEVVLKADVDMIGLENAGHFKYKSAIKYQAIKIMIKTENKSLQYELDETLKKFKMYMIHSGVSIYKVTGQHFVIRNKAQLYTYNFEKYSDQSVSKVKGERPNSDFLQSPYTWWTLRIQEIKDVGFQELQKYTTKVDLELGGFGRYLDELDADRYAPGFLNNLDLAEYYDTYDPSDNEMLPAISKEPFQRHCSLSPLRRRRSSQVTSSKFDDPIFARIQTTVGNPATVQTCYHQLQCYPNTTTFLENVTFDGEYELVTDPDNDNFGAYLTAMDYSEDSQMDIRFTMKINVIVEVRTYERYSFLVLANGTARDVDFKSGREFETELGDGRKVTNTITVNMEDKSATRVIKMMDFEATNEAKLCNWGLRVTLRAKDAEAVLDFKRL